MPSSTVGNSIAFAVALLNIVTIEIEAVGVPTKSNVTTTTDRPSDLVIPATVTSATTHSIVQIAPNSSNNGQNSGDSDLWYGKDADVEGLFSCKWPSDYEQRYKFCAARQRLSSAIKPQFGILDDGITRELINSCSPNNGGRCSADSKMNRTDLIERAKLWSSQINEIAQFGACLKKNIEGMVNLCKDNAQVTQTVSGIAGLHLGIVNVTTKAHEKLVEKQPGGNNNDTYACLEKLSEALHFTGAFYLSSRFYSKNVVACWDVKKGACSPMCKQFALALACLKAVCPVLSDDLPKFPIWQWYFADPHGKQEACDIEIDKLQCLASDSFSIVASTTPTPGLQSYVARKSKEALEQMKSKYQTFKLFAESRTGLKFFQVLLITGGALAIFVGAITLLCMCYHGLICQRRSRSRRHLRYAKLEPEDIMGKTAEDQKALTRDYDDIE